MLITFVWRVFCLLKMSELQRMCVLSPSIYSTCLISSPIPMFDQLLESSRWDDSNKWSDKIKFWWRIWHYRSKNMHIIWIPECFETVFHLSFQPIVCWYKTALCIKMSVFGTVFSSPEHMLRMSFCDRSPSVVQRLSGVRPAGVRPSVRPFTFSNDISSETTGLFPSKLCLKHQCTGGTNNC